MQLKCLICTWMKQSTVFTSLMAVSLQIRPIAIMYNCTGKSWWDGTGQHKVGVCTSPIGQTELG